MIKRFIQDERGGAYYWAVALIGIVLVGMAYVGMDIAEEYFFETFSVQQNVGADQRTFLHSMWTYGVPTASIGILIFWALTQSQKRRDF